nr:MAG TPA: hypothetical protein [Caudoviricetes sp.]
MRKPRGLIPAQALKGWKTQQRWRTLWRRLVGQSGLSLLCLETAPVNQG